MSDKSIDVTGLTCPMPLIRLSQAVAAAGAGKRIKITGDDPIFEQGVRDFCDLNQHQVLQINEMQGRTVEILIETARDEGA